MNRKYELVYVVSPEATDEQVAELHTQVESIVQRLNGTLEKTENWGRRKLAYEIGRHKEGTYVLEVILREHVDNLGKRGEIVKVADGYARNYLLPRKLALLATDGNRKHVERERKIMETREAEEKSGAEAIAARLAAVEISIARRVGDTEQLYGSVTSADIVDFLKGKGFDVDRRKLILPEPIKAIGDYDVPLKLHREVTVPLKVKVVKEGAAKEGSTAG